MVTAERYSKPIIARVCRQRIADNARTIGADALATHRLLADGADADGRHTIVVEAIHGQSLSDEKHQHGGSRHILPEIYG